MTEILKGPSKDKIKRAEDQIIKEQRVVDFDTSEFTVDYLVQQFKEGEFFVPGYQRKFIWSPSRRCKFIESMILGLPIPFLFCANADEGRLEIVDGAQRIQTLQQFLSDKLQLEHLEKLTELNGFKFSDLTPAQQRKFKFRSLRMVVLSDKTDIAVRRDLFERINTGSDLIKQAELRKGAFAGPFYSLVQECAGDGKFMSLCPLSDQLRKRGEGEELVLRYFAYSESYLEFKHSVKDFLNTYIKRKNLDFSDSNSRNSFSHMLNFVSKYFPNGFAKAPSAKSTPRVRFEAISVGVHLALNADPKLAVRDMSWLISDAFKRHTTTHASNSSVKLRGRIEFVRDALLEGR